VGTSVVIFGSGFTSTSQVMFNGTVTTFVINSDSQITAPVPTGAVTGSISITTANGTTYSVQSFTVTP
jgi:hypothetical protein